MDAERFYKIDRMLRQHKYVSRERFLKELEVSPQRLVHYRDNWYLDAWCHMRKGLRSFSIDRVREAEIRPAQAIDVAETELDAVLGSGYGIFSGRDVTWAKLRFSSTAARWVAAETWHPKQKTTIESDGSYVLELPYSDDRELLRDILKHGADVEVLAPVSLRSKLKAELARAAKRYRASALPRQFAKNVIPARGRNPEGLSPNAYSSFVNNPKTSRNIF